jgi:hypothetical protein
VPSLWAKCSWLIHITIQAQHSTVQWSISPVHVSHPTGIIPYVTQHKTRPQWCIWWTSRAMQCTWLANASEGHGRYYIHRYIMLYYVLYFQSGALVPMNRWAGHVYFIGYWLLESTLRGAYECDPFISLTYVQRKAQLREFRLLATRHFVIDTTRLIWHKFPITRCDQ